MPYNPREKEIRYVIISKCAGCGKKNARRMVWYQIDLKRLKYCSTACRYRSLERKYAERKKARGYEPLSFDYYAENVMIPRMDGVKICWEEIYHKFA